MPMRPYAIGLRTFFARARNIAVSVGPEPRIDDSLYQQPMQPHLPPYLEALTLIDAGENNFMCTH